MSTALVGVSIGLLLVALGVLLIVVVEHRRAAALDRALHEARVKATALVIGFEHTPVHGPSRDRSLPGKARRRARRS